MGSPIPEDTRLKGPFKPMRFEATVEDCIVAEGEIPPDLNGGFYRVGPTWKRPTVQGTNGLQTMDGMVQGLVIENGRADFRNRWVRTPKYLAEERAGRALFEWGDGFGDWRDWGWGQVKRTAENSGVPQGTNAVNIFPFAGEVLASGEQGSPPIALDPITLETRGIVPWSPSLARGITEPACVGDGAFTAHPKWDVETGTLYGWSYQAEPPYVTLNWVDPNGTVHSRELWDAPYESVTHDIWLTEHYIVMPFQPLVANQDRVRHGLGVYGWHPDRQITLAVIPRAVDGGPVRYAVADFEPQFVMHTLGGNEVGSKLLLDAPVFEERPPVPFEDQYTPGDPDVKPFFSLGVSRLGRWTVDLDKLTVSSEWLDDRPAELPKVDERFFARGYQNGFLVGGDRKRRGMSMKSLIHRNIRTQGETEYVIRGDVPVAVLEPTFAPRSATSDEGDGYLIVPVSRWVENLSDFYIFDTDDISAGPVTRIELPFGMGFTAHGHWLDFETAQGVL